MHNSMYYNNFNPYAIPLPPKNNNGIFSSLTRLNWEGFLNNTQKTLNVINQAIPIYYQIKPIYNNAKTMFRIMSSFNEKDNLNSNINDKKEKNTSNQPVFFT